MVNGTIKTLFADEAKTQAILPRTTTNAVTDSEGNTIESLLVDKQEKLVSGVNIKTINNESILTSGNINASEVSVSQSGTSTTEAKYLTVDGTEYKLGGGSVGFDVIDYIQEGSSVTINDVPYNKNEGEVTIL